MTTLSLRIKFLFRKIFTRYNVFGQCPTHVWNRLSAYPNSILDHPPPPSAFSLEQSHSEIIRRIQRECQRVLFFSPYRFVLQFLNLRDTLTAVNRSFCKTRLYIVNQSLDKGSFATSSKRKKASACLTFESRSIYASQKTIVISSKWKYRGIARSSCTIYLKMVVAGPPAVNSSSGFGLQRCKNPSRIRVSSFVSRFVCRECIMENDL